MIMSYLLGVDVGTTAVKCVLFDLSGKVVASGRTEYPLIMPKPGFVEAEAETYWNAFKESLGKVLSISKIDAEEILGVSVSSQGESFVMLDRDGYPLSRVIVWLDNRSEEEAQIIKREFGVDEVYRITGQNDVISTWTATKILWLKRNQPAVFKKVHKFLLLEDYFIYRLSGRFITDYSIVSSSLLFDISRKRWWNDILSFIGLDEDNLPELKSSGVPAGDIDEKVAKETGLCKHTTVSTGAYDQAASAVGVGNIEPGVVSETTGAALAIVATTNKMVLDPMRRMPCHYHAAPGKYFLQPWCHTAGAILKWFRDNFGHVEIEAADKMGLDSYDLLTLEAAQVPPGSDGLILLPHFMGAASPEFDSKAKGVLFGLTLYHGKGHIIRAIMESVAYMLRRNIEMLEEMGIEIREVRSCGGAARSPLWNQIKADVLQKPVLTIHTEETAALGAAMLAGLATKTFSSLEEAAGAMISIKDRKDSLKDNKTVYEKRYKTYTALYDRIKELF
jgi:xylulokinase